MAVTPNSDAVEAQLQAIVDSVSTPSTEEAAPVPDPAQAATIDDTPSLELTEGGEEADEKPASSSGDDLVQKIIDSKYKGDRNAFVKGLYEQWNSSSRMAREIEDLKKLVAERPTQTATPESDQDIQWLTNRSQALDWHQQNNQVRQNQIVTEIDDLRQKAAMAAGRIEASDDDGYKAKQERIKDTYDRQLQDLRREWNDLKKANFEFDREKFSVSRLLAEKNRLYEKPVQRQEQTPPDQEKWSVSQVESFETTVFEVGLNAGLMPGTPEFDEFLENVRAKVVYEHYKHSGEDGLSDADNEKLVRSAATKELTKYKTTQFKEFSAEKAQATGTKLPVPSQFKSTKQQPAPGTRTAPSIPKGNLTAAQARAHAARVLGG